MKNRAPDRRPRFITSPKRCAATTPIATNTWAIRISSRIPSRVCSIRLIFRSAAPPSMPNHATPSDQVNPGHPKGSESTETTHFNVVDAEGNAVAVTYTLERRLRHRHDRARPGIPAQQRNGRFRSEARRPEYVRAGAGRSQSIQPNKRPLSSMTPTMLLRDGKLFMVVGAPGGSRIITGVTAGDFERRRFRDERAGSGRFSALSSSMEAGQAGSGKGIFAGHRGAAEARWATTSITAAQRVRGARWKRS